LCSYKDIAYGKKSQKTTATFLSRSRIEKLKRHLFRPSFDLLKIKLPNSKQIFKRNPANSLGDIMINWSDVIPFFEQKEHQEENFASRQQILIKFTDAFKH
jgi:hypothetical protein